MSGKILDVHTITPATGWVFDDFGTHIACFALVTVYQEEYSSTSKMVIALSEHEIGTDLIGDTITERMLSIRREE